MWRYGVRFAIVSKLTSMTSKPYSTGAWVVMAVRCARSEEEEEAAGRGMEDR